ncbi:MAG: AAA family ATPase [Candidatus Pacebacteria bacterium]|nr:AAA family ATPase [Candidatus Paceibacterota bacterium]
MSFTSKQKLFVEATKKYMVEHGDQSEFTKDDLQTIADTVGLKFPHWITRVPTYKVGRGLFSVPVDGKASSSVSVVKPIAPAAVKPPTPAVAVPAPVVEMTKGANGVVKHVPSKDDLFVPFGSYTDVVSILKSDMFYPIFVTGLSGNGKTFMIEQACAKSKREMFRVNITIETDEDDLLGGFRLVDGETVWFDGPVVEAMRKGAVLLLDEVDLASTKIMCLQPVLEGKGVFLKKINEYVDCQPGFTIVATANTKGKGDETGNFIGAGVLNEAFLERFPITVEQEYPAIAVEKKILSKVFDSLNVSDSEFIEKLVNWADIIRKTYMEGAIDELITTRRLVHISNAYAIFNMDRMKAISMCVNRFDDETKTAMVDLYTKVDGDAQVTDEPTGLAGFVDAESSEEVDNDVPF